jgi:hypothetical protein
MDRNEITAEEMRELVSGMFKSNLGLKHFQDYMKTPNEKSLKLFVTQATPLKKTLDKMLYEYSSITGRRDSACFFISEQGEDTLFGDVKIKDFGTPESDIVLINRRFLRFMEEFYTKITEAGYVMRINLGYRYRRYNQYGNSSGHFLGKAVDFSLFRDGRLVNHIGMHNFLEDTADSIGIKSGLTIFRKFVHLQLRAVSIHRVVFDKDPTCHCSESLVPISSGKSR